MRRALFVSPAVPAPARSGLRMRGWIFLQGLAQHYRITLIAGSPAFPDESPADVEALGDLVEQATLLRFRALADPGLLRRRLLGAAGRGQAAPRDWAVPTPAMTRRIEPLQAHNFDLVHVFRLYMMPVARVAVAGRSDVPVQLDLDDWESRTRLALAELLGPGDRRESSRLRAEALAFRDLERTWLPRMARCFVCSEGDARELSTAYGLRQVAVVDNAVRQPPQPAPQRATVADELLFVGSLGYAPNEMAVRFLLDEVLPGLRSAPARGARLVVAGAGAGRALRRRLRAATDATWVDSPASIEPLYERAVVALAPVRAGGGTRIKILEAFAQGRPVVATAAAVAGLGVEAGVHFLIAESPVEWVQAIRSLLDSPELRRRLVAAASDWLRRHSLERSVERAASLSG